MKKFEILNLTKHELPVVISIPHSGVNITEKMKVNLLDNVIFSNVDWYLPQLYSFLEELGFTTIINNINRYEIDPNRDIKDQNQNASYVESFIYTKTTFGNEIYKKELDSSEVEQRINEFYNPYHQVLKNALQEKLKYFDKVYLIDLHSFGKDLSVDIILGNDNGKTTSDSFLELIVKLLKDEGFRVKNNVPYSGGYITKHYGNRLENCEALQIELWYGAYIEKRKFGDEEFPNINETVFLNAQQKMKEFFEKLKKFVT